MSKMSEKGKTSKVDPDDLLSVIKGTHRGRIGAFLIIFAVVCGLWGGMSAISAILCVIAGGSLIGSVKASADKAADKKAQIALESKKAATKKIGEYLYVNENSQTWCVPSAGLIEYKFSDLLDFCVVQDGETISSGNVLNAIAGGVVFGWAGLLVGANKTKTAQTCSKLQIQLNVNSISNPIIRIDLISYEVKRSSDDYKKAVSTMEEITGVLRVIKSRNQT